MERTDIKGTAYHGRAVRPDQVTLSGTGREAELLVTGLRVLLGQLSIRDATTRRGGVVEAPYGRGGANEGPPLFGEVSVLLAQIEARNYVVEVTDATATA